MDDVERGTCIIWFLIFGALYIGTPINLSTPRLYNVWFYSCCFSNHTDCCSAGFSLYFNTVHLSRVLLLFCVLFHKYHPVASALSDFIPSVWKAPQCCGSAAAIHYQPVRRCWGKSPYFSFTDIPATPAWNLHRCLFCAFINAHNTSARMS